MPIDRPMAGGDVALGDDLARIGLAVVYEAAAKSVTASALRALCNLDEEKWKRLERQQFGQMLDRLEKRASELADPELTARLDDLRTAVGNALSAEEFERGLAPLRGQTHWTSGEWDFGAERRPWNGLQNTTADYRLLSHHLVRIVRRANRHLGAVA